jgi:hypothetical protein
MTGGVNVRHIISFLVLAAAAALVACATPAPAPTPAPVATHAVPANPSAAASPGTFHAPFGYEKVMVSDGTVIYCRNDLDTDSRVKRTRVCLTEAQLTASRDNSQNFIDDVQRHGVGATSTGTPANAMGH